MNATRQEALFAPVLRKLDAASLPSLTLNALAIAPQTIPRGPARLGKVRPRDASSIT